MTTKLSMSLWFAFLLSISVCNDVLAQPVVAPGGGLVGRFELDLDGEERLAITVANYRSFCRDVVYRIQRGPEGNVAVDVSNPAWAYRFGDSERSPCLDVGASGRVVEIDVASGADLAAIDDVISVLMSPPGARRNDLGRVVVHDERGFLKCDGRDVQWDVMSVYLGHGRRYDDGGKMIPQRLDPVALRLGSSGDCGDLAVQLYFPAGGDQVHVHVTRGFALPL